MSNSAAKPGSTAATAIVCATILPLGLCAAVWIWVNWPWLSLVNWRSTLSKAGSQERAYWLAEAADRGLDGVPFLVEALTLDKATARHAASIIEQQLAVWDQLQPQEAACFRNELAVQLHQVIRSKRGICPDVHDQVQRFCRWILQGPAYPGSTNSVQVTLMCQQIMDRLETSNRSFTPAESHTLSSSTAWTKTGNQSAAIAEDAGENRTAATSELLESTAGNAAGNLSAVRSSSSSADRTTVQKPPSEAAAKAAHEQPGTPAGHQERILASAQPASELSARSQTTTKIVQCEDGDRIVLNAASKLEQPLLERSAVNPPVGSPSLDGMTNRQLLHLLVTGTPEQQESARRELVRRGFSPAELHWAGQVLDGDLGTRLKACRQLAQLGGQQAAKWLLILAGDEAAEVRLEALSLLAVSADPLIRREAERRAAMDPDPRVRNIVNVLSTYEVRHASRPSQPVYKR